MVNNIGLGCLLWAQRYDQRMGRSDLWRRYAGFRDRFIVVFEGPYAKLNMGDMY